MSVEIAPELLKFTEYLRLRTDHLTPDYLTCRSWLLDYISDIGLEVVVDKEFVPGYPVIVASLPGSAPHLPSLLLNSHVDVAPAQPEPWTHHPFSGHVTKDGRVIGRGAQDMKCVGVQHLELLRRIKRGGNSLLRTVNVSFVPDEEPLGWRGMAQLVESEEFKELNLGVVLDEGLPREDEAMNIYYGERHLLWATITFKGSPGHGSMFIEDTAIAKLTKFLNTAQEYRETQQKRQTGEVSVSDVNTLNINMISGGVQPNCVPSELKVTIDCRVRQKEKLSEIKEMINGWVNKAGGGLVEIINQSENDTTSSTDPSDKWWRAILAGSQKHAITLVPQIFPANTDSRFLRKRGIPCYGFSPINNTPVLFHDKDEWLGVSTFLNGIDILGDVVRQLADVQG